MPNFADSKKLGTKTIRVTMGANAVFIIIKTTELKYGDLVISLFIPSALASFTIGQNKYRQLTKPVARAQARYINSNSSMLTTAE